MIPFAIFDLMVPSGLALAPFRRKVAGQSSSQISRATLHDYLIKPIRLIVSSQGYKTYTVFFV